MVSAPGCPSASCPLRGQENLPRIGVPRLGLRHLGVITGRVDKSIHSPEHNRLTALLRELREQAGLNQADLADLLGVSQTWVSKYELGERRLDLVQLRQVCEALGTTAAELVSRWESQVRVMRRRKGGGS